MPGFERATLAPLLGVSDAGLLGRALADLQPCEPVLQLVDRARDAGVRVAVLSNSGGTGQYNPYAGYDLDLRFDAVVISDQLGLRNPDPAIQLTADKLGVPPAVCVFVDNTERNLPAAETLGMSVVHFRESQFAFQKIEALLGLRAMPDQRSPPHPVPRR